MRVTARHTTPRCAYCHEPLRGEALTCSDCSTLVHEDCQLDQCPTLGCGSLEPWAWTDIEPPRLDEPVPQARSVRIWLSAAIVPLTGIGAFVLGQSIVVEPGNSAAQTAEIDSTPVPTQCPISPWYSLGGGTVLVTRTESKKVSQWMSIACGVRVTEDGRREGVGETKTGWDYFTEQTERSYRLQSLPPEYARVVLEVHAGERGCSPKIEWLRFPRHPQSSRSTAWTDERTLLEERTEVSVAVPAGSFTCTYRKEEGYTKSGFPAVIETWSDPLLPLPIQRLVTWTDPIAPDIYKNTERTVLLALERRPPDPEE